MALFQRRPAPDPDEGVDTLMPLSQLPSPSDPARFLGANKIDPTGDLVLLSWQMSAGRLVVAYSEGLFASVYPGAVRAHFPDLCALAQVGRQWQRPDGPALHYFTSTDSSAEETSWREYARVIGQPAPYWPLGVRHAALMLEWQPGDPLVTTTPQLERDVTPLLDLAARYPVASDVNQVLRHCYRRQVRVCAHPSRTWAADCDEWGLNQVVRFAAVADEVVDDGDLVDTLGESRARAAFAELFENRDRLSATVVRLLYRCGTEPEQLFPFGYVVEYQPELCTYLDEWLGRLDEVPLRGTDARFAIFDTPNSTVIRRFVDPATGAPVVAEQDEHGALQYSALAPRRLPASTPLAELILDGADDGCEGTVVWVRTANRVLWPAPTGLRGLAWGYHGAGPDDLAAVVEWLLDDITSRPNDDASGPTSQALGEILKQGRADTTVLTRQQLEEARARG